MLFIIPGTTYLSLMIYDSVISVCIALGGMFFIFFFVWYALLLRNILGPFFKEYMLTIARPVLLAVSMGIFTYLLSLPLQAWPKTLSAPVLIAFGAGYYAVMTLHFNPQFVDELEKLLPGKMGHFLVKIRYKLTLSYIG
jgi:hypothetical protein